MSDPIWAKGDKTTLDEQLMAFTAGDDVLLDRALFAYDIEATIAHVRGLGRIDLLTEDEVSLLAGELGNLGELFARGEFVLDERYEDGHSAIESHLTVQLGEVGKKVHTGRSRNDQVLVATRLYLRAQLTELHELCVQTAAVLLRRAEEEMQTPMPGYTHLQRAVVSTAGMWFAGFAEAFIDNAQLARSISQWVSANPLGTAAGFGVNLPLDRDFTTAELGFDRMQLSPIYAQNSRGKFELQAIDVLGQALLDVRRFAWDLSMFTTAEFGFVELPDAYTTGSSIMPNKRNPDVVELLRAAYAPLAGARAELVATLSLPSGYHRDLQNTKPPLIGAFSKGLSAMRLMPDLVEGLQLNRDAMRAAISKDMYATDVAIEAARDGVPFREAYREAARSGMASDRTPEDSINARTSPGGAADARLEVLEARLKSLRDGA